jgi:hypothetical protein
MESAAPTATAVATAHTIPRAIGVARDGRLWAAGSEAIALVEGAGGVVVGDGVDADSLADDDAVSDGVDADVVAAVEGAVAEVVLEEVEGFAGGGTIAVDVRAGGGVVVVDVVVAGGDAVLVVAADVGGVLGATLPTPTLTYPP